MFRLKPGRTQTNLVKQFNENYKPRADGYTRHSHSEKRKVTSLNNENLISDYRQLWLSQLELMRKKHPGEVPAKLRADSWCFMPKSDKQYVRFSIFKRILFESKDLIVGWCWKRKKGSKQRSEKEHKPLFLKIFLLFPIRNQRLFFC